ncbi:PucR family transcriptional regulator [Streptomyces sp. CA-249302]|uniref:PucR family transcriptional regulator n=1 Tax=Streptomyces sp. CA-249302 TaxID=3240058 RepID=UPI003D907ADC
MPDDDSNELLARVSAGLSRQAADLTEQLLGELLAEEPELRGDGHMVPLLRATVSGNVVTALHMNEFGLGVDQTDAPAEALEHARRLAQRGTPITVLLRAYRIGQRFLADRLIGEVRTTTSDPMLVAAALTELTRLSFGYIDRVSEQVVTAYQEERDRRLHAQIAVRSARVRALLGTGWVDVADSERVLGYRLARAHLGMVAWAEAGTDRLRELKHLVAELAEQARCQGEPLLVPADESTLWAWLPEPESGVDRIAVAGPEAMWVAVGTPATGLAGFRLTHQQARQAQSVAMAAAVSERAAVTCSAEVGPIALMCGDLGATKAWVRAVLGPLARDDDATAGLRDTVRVFLDTGGSFQTTAERLLLHRNTVQYRIRKAESLLGHPVRDRRLDLEIALLACRWLGSTILGSAGD